MRQVFAYVEPGQGQKGLQIAASNGGHNISFSRVISPEGEMDLLFLEVENDKFDSLLGELQELGKIRLTLFPLGVIALKPPAKKAPEEVTDVSSKGPFEIFLSALQSIGSWKGFLSYSVAAGIVSWIGLYTNTIYLLVAAMLIAPFASPAMILAMGTARGDETVIKRSLLRYGASLSLSIVTTACLSYIMGQQIATEMMIETSKISSTAFLLAVTAGAAGALTLCKSDRDSLVTAAGPGMLIAASLAPPAGVVGMSAAIGEWDMVKNAVFLLITQLVGINIAGTVVFYIFGLKPKGIRYERGSTKLRIASLAITMLAAIGILFWQFSSKPNLERSTRARDVGRVVKNHINKSAIAKPVEIDARFTRADIKGQNTVLIKAYVQKSSPLESDAVKKTLINEIKEEIKARDFNVTPLVDVTVLEE